LRLTSASPTWQRRIDEDGGTRMTTGVHSVGSSPKTLVTSVGQVVRSKPPIQGVGSVAHCQDSDGSPFGKQRDVAAREAPTSTLARIRSSVPGAGLPPGASWKHAFDLTPWPPLRGRRTP
jgi:hypothetical protein